MEDLPKVKSIKSWSEEDRPREKLIQKGVKSLTDSELLAILVGSGTQKLSAVDLCKQILVACDNSLDLLSRKNLTDLTKFKGIGEAKAITIIAAMELGRRRMAKGKQEEIIIESSKDAYEFIGPYLMDLAHEEFWVILMNPKRKVIKKVQISMGGMTLVGVDPKSIFKAALELSASSIILVHNHPSGEPTPSHQDNNFTNKMVEAGKLMDIRVLDHIIIGGFEYYSFMDSGQI